MIISNLTAFFSDIKEKTFLFNLAQLSATDHFWSIFLCNFYILGLKNTALPRKNRTQPTICSAKKKQDTLVAHYRTPILN